MLERMERSAIKWFKKRGLSNRQLAAHSGRDRDTIARVRKEPADQTYHRPPQGSLVDAYTAEIEQWIRQGLPTRRMLELAREDDPHPYTGSQALFYARVRALRQQLSTPAGDGVLRFEGLPGEYVQIDWGEHKVEFVRSGRQKVCFLAVRLKFSRYLYVAFHDNMWLETLLRGLLRACVHLGGVPWHWVFDNMKTVVTGRDRQKQPLLHPTFARFAAELDFHPNLCAPRSPQQKGTVENLVGWVKSNFFPGRTFVDWDDLWRQGADWQRRVNHQPCQAHEQWPARLLKQEQAPFSPLPKSAHDYGLLHLCQVSWSESVFHYQTNRYSVPVEYRGQPVLVRVHEKRLKVYVEDASRWESVRIADHPCCCERGRHIIDPTHFAAVLARKPRGKVMLYRQPLLDLGEPVTSYIVEVCRRHRADFGQQILTLYGLWQGRGDAEFLGAVTAAQAVGVYGAEYVTYLLEVPQGERGEAAQRWQGLPTQQEVDRPLEGYEAFVHGAVPKANETPSANGRGAAYE
jgi:transposase